MRVDWIELAQKMAKTARAGVADDRERLRKILAEQQRNQAPAQSSSHSTPGYDTPMAKAKKFEIESPAPILDAEDEETLAAIDEGIRDAKAGRTVLAEEVRKRLPMWITGV
jgi:hypothetical protein